ncbi:hypothetical protein DIS24_g4113 [Lasiodiplodia hormozganensis]|uniref:Uncharacterized protein n=1 Tax=Lasiodiplodia hormozganensis TaxID=869390 RepID=A0AA40D185_9PEZI|nr:hypothetical protein DIS24_g4113 [Lasiodiplodia hormozganensis]
MEARFRSFINELVVLKQILRDATGSGEGAESTAADSNPQSNAPPTTGSFSVPDDLSGDPADLSDDPANPFSDTAYPLSDQSEVDSSVPSTPSEQQLTVPRTPTPQSLNSMRVLISPRRRRKEGEEEDEEEEEEDVSS